ncbi:MAG: hypothetical protein KF893_12160 [Caldilineaceae bacterium]|nr:hypothetical protein [Caldilineaceae bacterium]
MITRSSSASQFWAWRWFAALAFVVCVVMATRLSLSAQWWGEGPNFGWGRGVQQVDPSGYNRMPLWPGQGTVTIDFTLYPLTPVEFVRRMAIYEPYNNSVVEVVGLTATVAWQQTFTTYDWYTPQYANFPANVPSGFYAITASSSAGTDADYVIVGRNGLMVKQAAGGQVIAWLTNLQGRQPSPGVAVTLYDREGAALTSALTDADGVAHLWAAEVEPFMVVAQGNGEVSAVGFHWQWTSEWQWWDSAPAEDKTLYLYTDRPIYRPNQIIHYQAFVRQRSVDGYSQISANTPITVTLRDARNNLIATQPGMLDAFGALHGEFTIGDSPPLGWWTLILNVDGQTQTQRLRVEEYRKPEYQVMVSAQSNSLISGDSTQITVAADYYFGQPVANAQVQLKIYRYTLPRYGWYWWSGGGQSPYYNQLIETRTGVTAPDGTWTMSYAPEATDQYDAVYTFEAEVTDARALPVTGAAQLPVYWNSFVLSAAPHKWGYSTDESVLMDVQSRNHDSSAAGGKSVTVRIIRDYWDETPESDAVPAQTLVTDGAGRARFTFVNVPQGWYRVEAQTVDGRGRKVLAVNYLWVFDPNANDWYYFNENELSILTDKESYLPGETARLLIQSKINGVALLTLERDGIYREQIVQINGPVTQIDLPIDEQFAPNVVARLHIFKTGDVSEWERTREGRLLMARTELIVPADNKKLNVSISADAPQYRPGESAALTVQVTDANGVGVPARVGLVLVDEAIYALQADLSADLFDVFWGRRASSVLTYDSLVRRPWGYNAPPVEGTPSPGAPAGGIGGGDSADTVTVRRNFVDTAYWNATITTGADGKATVMVDLPDNLTTWRVIARVIDAEANVGTGQKTLLVTQEIIVRPALPRFGVVGDRFEAGVVAQNFSAAAINGSASVNADNLVLLNNEAAGVALPTGGSAALNWTAVAARSGTGLITATLQTAAGGDIVELPFPIKPFAVPDRWLAAGGANLSATEHFTLPLNAVAEGTTLEVRISPSLALGVLDGLDELIDFPYGCVEQTMSRVVPSAVAAKAYADLGLPNPKAADLPKIVEQGLQKIYGFQHGGGGWGWFYDDNGDAFLTAYVLFGLHTIAEAGFNVDGNVLQRGFDHLDNTLNGTTDVGIHAFAHYVKALAGRGDLPILQALIHQTAEMDASQIAALALALHLNGDGSNANTVLNTLLARAVETTTTVYWPLAGDYWDGRHWQTMASDTKNSALAVRALATLRPNDPKLPKAVRWLLENRRGAGWGNTQATAFAVLGLVDVIKSTGELQSNYSYNVSLNGQSIGSGAVTPQTAAAPIPPIKLSGDQLTAGDNTLQIERSAGAGSLYYTAILNQQIYYEGFTPVSSVDEGLSVARSYKLAEGTPRNDGAYNLNDLVEVTLKVKNNQELWYVLITDPIPAGFEVVEERMNPRGWGGYDDVFYWNIWGYNQKEARDDRVEFFITNLWQGEHTFTYLMRATTAGDFSVLPATASPMYKDEVWGRTGSQRVLVAPDKLGSMPRLAGDFDRSCQITAFDAQLTAAAWRTDNLHHDVNGDGKVDLRDVAAVGSWQGTTCGVQRSLPGAGSGSASFTITTNKDTLWVAEEVRVTVALNSLNTGESNASALGGFDLTLNVDPTRLTLKRMEVNPALGRVIPLGPQTEPGGVAVGIYDLPAYLPSGTPLATLVFTSSSVGSTTIRVAEANAVDGAGRTIQTNAAGNHVLTVDGTQTWLPIVGR